MVDMIYRSFGSGEISPELSSRADLEKYATGLALCKNFIVKAQGGAYSRPGFQFTGELKDSSKRARLIPFEFNTEQAYILVFEDSVMRVIMDGGYVIDSITSDVYELAIPYTEDELPRLVFTQDADVMTIVHPNHDPKVLSRIDHDSWQIDDVDFTAVVDTPENLSLAATGAGAGDNNKTYTYVVTAVDNFDIESLPSTSASITTPSLSVTAGVQVSWDAVTGAVYYRIYKDPSDGSGIYGWIGDSVNPEFTDFNIAPVTSDAPPGDYLPFDGTRSKPSTVGYYQQRQIYANTLNEPQKVFATRSGVYNSMRSSDPPKDDDALFFTLKDRKVNEIRHIVNIDGLVLLTSGAEWSVTDGQDMVLTPTTLGFKPRTFFGCSWTAPAITGDSVIYVQNKGKRVRDIYFDASQSFRGTDLSIMAEHLIADYDVVEMAWAQEPYGIVWCVREDGVLLGLTYQREHEVWAWHWHDTDGKFESCATIPEGERDALYVIVRRYIDGEWRRYVERQMPRVAIQDHPEECFCVDSGLTYRGVPADEISGLDHLEGKTVTILADGNEVEGLVVTDGKVTLPDEASVVHIGLPYTPAMRTLDIDMSLGKGDESKGREISVSRVFVEILDSRGGHVATVDDDGTLGEFIEIPPRSEADGYDTIKLRSWKYEQVMPPNWNRAGAVQIEQRSPLPLTILSIVPRVDIS